MFVHKIIVFQIIFSSIYFHISQVNLQITEIRGNKIITRFDVHHKITLLTQVINGQCEYNVDLPKVARNMMGPIHKSKLVKLQVPVKLMCGKYYGERIKM